jgi:hypothetical protein
MTTTEQFTAAAPAIPFAWLRQPLAEYCLGERGVRRLQHRQDFPELQFRPHQIFDVHQFAESELCIQISMGGLK